MNVDTTPPKSRLAPMAESDAEAGGFTRTLKDLVAGAAGGIAQVILGQSVNCTYVPENLLFVGGLLVCWIIWLASLCESHTLHFEVTHLLSSTLPFTSTRNMKVCPPY